VAGYSCVTGCGPSSKVPELDKTLILHWDGRAFSRIPSPSPGRSARLASVAASPSGAVYAVGYYCTSGCGGSSEIDRTLLLSWSHDTWSRLASASPGPSARLASVSVGPSGTLWAVGYYCESDCFNLRETDHTLILRPRKTSWLGVQSPSPGDKALLTGVSVGAGGTAWAVGWDLAGTLVMRWDMRRWRIVNIQTPGPMAQLGGVSAGPGGSIWAVGGYCVYACHSFWPTDHALIVRLGARGWHVEATPRSDSIGRLIGVSAGAGGTAWAVGYSCLSRCGTTSERDRTLVLRSNGTTWIAG
jgi:hypothetical protein